MSNKQKLEEGFKMIDGSRGQDICDRTRAFALRIVAIYQSVRRDDVGRVIGKQMLRSGTSIGVNTEEAQAAQSSRDFVAKLSIALKEARETRYWLKLLRDTELFPPTKFDEILDEVEQIIRIIYTIINNTKKNF